MQNYDKVNESLKDIIIRNFMGGIAWGLGATIGLAIVLAILGFILKQVNFVPIVGNFVTQVSHYVYQQNTPRFFK